MYPLVRKLFNLETAVGRVRVGCDGVRWQGAPRLLAPASNEKQRGRRAAARLNRTRSALTHTMKVCVTVNLNTHVLLHVFTSGQLPFLG